MTASGDPGPLALIAGRGDLPVHVVEGARAAGRDVFVARLKGFEEPRLADHRGASIGIGELGKLIKALKAEGCRDIVFAGHVSRPDFSALSVDLRGARLLPKAIKVARNGDDALLRLILSELEAEGFRILGAETFAENLLAPDGQIAGPRPSPAALEDVARAQEVARVIGELDIGQGCVVCDGLVLAVEAQEGTDAMLARCADLPSPLKGRPGAPRGVLVKVPKPIQTRKIDLPTIGLATLEGVQKAGLAGIAVRAGAALVIDRPALEAFGAKEGVFVWGLGGPE
ncbi:MAG: UDP-2,3-diacylglucosamine diphosphatase LpxI [Pseudomonadota bacterium]